MIRIVVENGVADQIRKADGQIELVDNRGEPIGVVRRPPTSDEISLAKARMGAEGPKFTIEQLIEKVESL